jgi:hypothetical protein
MDELRNEHVLLAAFIIGLITNVILISIDPLVNPTLSSFLTE